LPAGRVEVVIEATPPTRFTVFRTVAPLVKVTVPDVLAGSVAVKVTA
jgi:hypothetical protein